MEIDHRRYERRSDGPDLPDDDPKYRWRTKVEGSHAAVAFSADHKKVYATTEHGVRILDAALGKEEARIEAKDSNPIGLGVFPYKAIAADFTQSQVVFGNARGYFIKPWTDGTLPDSSGTIKTAPWRKTRSQITSLQCRSRSIRRAAPRS